jgi:hypothetical protein
VTASLDDRQQRIIEWLSEKYQDLASMYQSALAFLNNAPITGHERARVAQICHSMRELVNRLPDALGIPSLNGAKSDYSNHYQGLPDIAAKYPNLDLLESIEYVPVPQELAVVLENLIKNSKVANIRRADQVAAMLTEDQNSKHVVVREWMDLSKFFVKWAHLSGTQSSIADLPTDDVLKSRIGLVEVIVHGVMAPFFDNRHFIDDLLEDANFVAGTQSDE